MTLHVDDEFDVFGRDFMSIMDSFNFTQHVSGPTHAKGHTLDLVFTIGLNIDCLFSEDIFISDHHCIYFNLSFPVLFSPHRRVISSRFLNSSTSGVFFDIVLSPSNDVNSLVTNFNDSCAFILDNVCPEKLD